ncbi:Alpha-mannosidase 2x [Chamberlinius hualienensis]
MKISWIVFKRNRRRSLITLLIVFIVAVAISLMYLSFEVERMTLSKDEFMNKDQVSVLNQRLQQLEQQLRKNREHLNQLIQNVHSTDKKVDVERPIYPGKNGFKPLISLNVTNFVLACPVDSLPLQSKTDLRIPDLYAEVDFKNEDGGVWKQGWPLTYDKSQWSSNNKLHIFVIPHSHNDPGWLKTFENYYLDQTKHILNNMVRKLKEDPRRKMIWAEVSYLSFWWDKASDEERKEMFRLVHSGQLEIVTGGWVMNDEALTHYFAIMEQLMEGHEWLENHLSYYPENGWAIDPFGLSPTMAYVQKRMGLNHMVIQRVHYSIKKYLSKLKSAEFMWRQSWDHANVTDIFCHMMPFYSYDVPHTCGPDPKICCQFDFKRLPGGKVSCPWKIPPQPISPSNVAERAETLLDQYRKKAQLFRSNVVLVPLGDDFRFDKTAEWDQQYLNYQALFDFMNSKQEWNVKAQFGTLHDYFNAIEELWLKDSENRKPHVPSLSGDFFTYADRDDHYWSGYFSSRPLYKNMDRILETYLRAGEIIFSSLLAHLSYSKIEHKFPVQSLLVDLVNARRNVGLFQHHDGITGTGKDQVVIDYGKRMLSAMHGLQTVISRSAALLLSSKGEELTSSSIKFDLDDNRASHSSMPQKTLIEITEDGKVVVFYNSQGRHRKEMVSLLVSSSEICVINPDGNFTPVQINPVWHGTEIVDDKFEVYFMVEVPALGLSKYSLKIASKDDVGCSEKSSIAIYNSQNLPTSSAWNLKVGEFSEIHLQNAMVKAVFSSDGLLTSLTNLYDNHTETVTITFLMYGTTHKKDKSGAYLFLPESEATPIEYEPPSFRVTRGPLFSEVRTFLPSVEHSIQLRNSDGIDGLGVYVSNVVDIMKEINKEIVMRIKTSISNSKTFYTDNNGFQMTRRIILDDLPLQAHFYPISTATYIEDRNTRFTVLTGQPLGGSSLQAGWIEIILDRRLNQDDNRGLQQGVLDNKMTPSNFILLMEKRKGSESDPVSSGLLSLSAHLASLSLLYPVLRLIDASESPSVAGSKLMGRFSAAEGDLPCDMHIVTLRTATSELTKQEDVIYLAKNYSLLLVHHLGFDCGVYTPVLGCSLSNDKVNLAKVCGKYFHNIVTEVTLSGLYDYNKLPKTKTVLIPPMEINAYKLYR